MTEPSSLKGYHSGGHKQAALFSNGYKPKSKNTTSSLFLPLLKLITHFFISTSVPPSFDPSKTMVRPANLNSLSKTLPSPVPTLPSHQAARKRSTVNEHLGLISDNLQERRLTTLQASRRTALSLASVALIGSFGNGFALAEDNGYWLTGPIPVPPIYNKIANEKTGTRSFVRSGIYIADIKVKGSMYRLRKYAFDLLALGDLIGKDVLNYVRKYLRLKGTFMYYDFDKVISAASASDKQPLTDLANRLFDKFEKLEDAVKKEDLPETQSRYQDTTIVLQEVMDRMA